MTPARTFDTPVAVILFNRPDRIGELLQVLRTIRPSRILAIADGPRASRPADIERCRASRAALDRIDWPCTIERDFSDTNLGCDRRIVTGLDWAFAKTDRAIVLEDDVLPHPTFLPWAEAMLERFGDDPTVGIVCGHNHLGAWGVPGQDHIRSRNGSIWGWACTSRSWCHLQSQDLAGVPEDSADDIARDDLDPLLHAHLALGLQMFRRGELTAWDVLFYLRHGLAGLHAITSPVNLTRNTGVGADATRTLFADDFSALLEHAEARPIRPSRDPRLPDRGFERGSLLVQLLARCRNPAMAARLSRVARSNAAFPIDLATRHHLAPFLHAEESLRLLEHLASQGLSSPLFNQLLEAVRALTTPRVEAS
jgi:hypothetical protein